jgi:hypothetical protein
MLKLQPARGNVAPILDEMRAENISIRDFLLFFSGLYYFDRVTRIAPIVPFVSIPYSYVETRVKHGVLELYLMCLR